MTAIEAKFDALMNKFGNNERRMHMTLEVGIVDEGEKRNSADKGLTHEVSYQVEEARYTPAHRNHENFSYGGGAHQVQRPGQNL